MFKIWKKTQYLPFILVYGQRKEKILKNVRNNILIEEQYSINIEFRKQIGIDIF